MKTVCEQEILRWCEKEGYGRVIQIAVLGWAHKPGAWGLAPVSDGPRHMADWLHTMADQLDPSGVSGGTSSRDLRLAKMGALRWIHSSLVTDEIRAELDEWSEFGFVLLACGCLWRLEDLDDPTLQLEHEDTHMDGPVSAW